MTAQEILYVFRRATTSKTDADYVSINAHQALAAFGAQPCKTEFGIDVAEIDTKVEATRRQHLQELDNEIDELKKLIASGVNSAQSHLNKAYLEKRSILTGQMLPKPMIRVNVGALRRLMSSSTSVAASASTESTVTLPDNVPETIPVPAPVAVPVPAPTPAIATEVVATPVAAAPVPVPVPEQIEEETEEIFDDEIIEGDEVAPADPATAAAAPAAPVSPAVPVGPRVARRVIRR